MIKRQTIIWINDDQVYWRIYVTRQIWMNTILNITYHHLIILLTHFALMEMLTVDQFCSQCVKTHSVVKFEIITISMHFHDFAHWTTRGDPLMHSCYLNDENRELLLNFNLDVALFLICQLWSNTLKPEQNGRHFATAFSTSFCWVKNHNF